MKKVLSKIKAKFSGKRAALLTAISALAGVLVVGGASAADETGSGVQAAVTDALDKFNAGKSLGVLFALDYGEIEHAIVDHVFFHVFEADGGIVRDGHVAETCAGHAVQPGDVIIYLGFSVLAVRGDEGRVSLGYDSKLVELCYECHNAFLLFPAACCR